MNQVCVFGSDARWVIIPQTSEVSKTSEV